ncbi:MAG: SDR family oxidoreductase [Steroidobacteraceae bacterium]
MTTFKNKTALIVGASSEGGVGWATAKRFAAQGAKVAVAARRKEALDELAKQIGGVAFHCDVSNEASVVAMADQARAALGQFDLLVNCAGRPVPGLISQVGTAGLLETAGVEFFGNWFLLRYLPPLMRDGGAIVVISSIASTHVVPGVAAYAAGKAAANTLVRYAAVELAPRRIRVNAVVPASVDTPMNASFRDNEAVMKIIRKEVPLGRTATADDIAAATQWLCQDDCFATGALIPVDGGNHLRRAPFPDEMPTSTYDGLA